MDNVTYTKLSALIDDDFTVTAVDRYTYKKWDNEAKKMIMSHEWQEGYRKLYPVTTDKGKLDLGSGQIGSLLEAVMKDGRSDLINRTFHVKSNGKQGMDIRYFFNPVKNESDQSIDDPFEGLDHDAYTETS